MKVYIWKKCGGGESRADLVGSLNEGGMDGEEQGEGREGRLRSAYCTYPGPRYLCSTAPG